MIRLKFIVVFPMDTVQLDSWKARLPTDLLNEDTSVDFVPIHTFGKLLMDSHYNYSLHEQAIISAGINAEEEGYDGVGIETISDVGVNALRSRLSIPVIGPGQAAYAVAMMLGRRFSILTRWDRWKWLHDATLDSYGLRDRCASIRAPALPDETLLELPGTDAVEAAAIIEGQPTFMPCLLAEAQAAVETDGADVLVLASVGMQSIAAYLRPRVEVPVVDPGPLACKMLETWVALGLTHSKLAFPSPIDAGGRQAAGNT